MQRRHLFFAALATGLASTMAGCGFQLRQAPQFAFKSIFIQAPTGSPLALELRRNLQSNKNLQVFTRMDDRPHAEVVLDLRSEQHERITVGRSASGQIREYQIRLRIHFQLATPNGLELIPDTELVQQSDVSYDESLAIAKEEEITELYRSMQSNLVQLLMRRLAALPTIRPQGA